MKKHPRLSIISTTRTGVRVPLSCSGLRAATGSHVLIFDADAEYEPSDITALLGPLLRDRCSVVFGSRRFGHYTSYDSFRYALGNVGLTFITNLLFDSVITDLHTCPEVGPYTFPEELELTESGFGLDTQITAEDCATRAFAHSRYQCFLIARSRAKVRRSRGKTASNVSLSLYVFGYGVTSALDNLTSAPFRYPARAR